MIASQMIDTAAGILNDVTNTSWTRAALLAYLNDAQQMVSTVRPDSSITDRDILLAVNSPRQELPADGKRLVRVNHNRGPTAMVNGPVINGPIPMTEMDLRVPGWRSETGTPVKAYAYDDASPRTFWVWPHPAAGWWINIGFTVTPAVLTAENQTVMLRNEYTSAMLEWMLYRCFSRDSEESPTRARAETHKAMFFNMLDLKTQAELVTRPVEVEAR